MDALNRVPVVFTPDENFIIPTCVAIASIMESKTTTNYYFYIVLSNKIDVSKIQYFQKLTDLYADFYFEIVWIDSDKFEELKIVTKHLSSSAFYRLFLSEIFPNESKIMYHDGDILVLKDLGDMFYTDISDFYVAGVPSIYAIQNGKWKTEHIEKWKFTSLDNYIFSGDMVMNLDKIREDNLTDTFSYHMKLGYPSEDQDVINKCCAGKIRPLPIKYCMLSRWIKNDVLNNFEKQLYAQEDIKEAVSNPAIIHFAGADAKPWVNLRVSYGRKWWDFLKKILEKNEYQKWKENAKELTIGRDWSYYLKLLNERSNTKDLVIYGAGKAGRELYHSLVCNNYEAAAFFDTDLNKVGSNYCGVDIVFPKYAFPKYKDAIILMAVQGEWDYIKNYLIGLGYKAENLIKYEFKSEFYYQSIDLKYRQFEKMDRTLRLRGHNE